MKPKIRELNRKLAEWAGWRQSINYNDPELNDEYPPDFTQSLDACFKWLVSELLVDQRFTMTIWNGKKLWYAQLSRPHKFFIIKEAETLALALCLAIEKLIDGQ